MARSNPIDRDNTATIVDPDRGGVILHGREDRRDTNGRHAGNGRNGVAGRSNDHNADAPAHHPEQGTLTVEGNTTRIEGNREALEADAYFLERTLPTLRGFVRELVVKDQDHFTEAQEVRYTGVISDLANRVRAEVTAPVNRGCESYLRDIGGRELANRIERSFDAQFAKGPLLIDTYAEEALPGEPTIERLNQEKALLVYAELLLNRMNGQLAIDEPALGRTFGELGFSPEQAHALGEAFTAVYGHVEPTLTSFVDEIIGNDANFIPVEVVAPVLPVVEETPPEPPEAPPPPPEPHVRELNRTAVCEYLEHKNDVTEGAYRVLINALDRLNEPAQQRWIEQREQNPEINLNERPLSTWQTQVQDRIEQAEGARRQIESRDYINGLLGTRKEETKFLGFKGNHEVKHHVKNVKHKAPVREAGSSRDSLVDVEATEIAIMSGIWQGEVYEDKTLHPGESRPKDYFGRVVDVTVWSVSLNNADAVANLLDQLAAADAMQMDGESVGRVLGNHTEVPNAKAFRIPVIDHRGQPTFLVVDRETYGEMVRVARISQASYAALLRRDSGYTGDPPRYAVHDRETRHAAYRPQLREHQATPQNWVDQERDFILAEEISQQRIAALRTGTELDRFVAGQLDEAAVRYQAQFNEFQMNFCRESQYRELAISRLARLHLENAPDYQTLLRQEMNAVALEYINRWSAFRGITTRLLELRDAAGAERELLDFLANIDRELEVRVRVDSADVREEDVRRLLGRRTLTPIPVESTIVPGSPLPPAEAVSSIMAGEAVAAEVLGRPLEAAELPLVIAPAAEAIETARLGDLVGRAQLRGLEHHDPKYHWTDGGRDYGFEDVRGNVSSAVDVVTEMSANHIMNTDRNSSRIAFVPTSMLIADPRVSELPPFPPESVAVRFDFRVDHMDSARDGGELVGILVLSREDAAVLREQVVSHPENFFNLVHIVNGGEINSYEPGRPMSMTTQRRGDAVSVYELDATGQVTRTETSPLPPASEPRAQVETIAPEPEPNLAADEAASVPAPSPEASLPPQAPPPPGFSVPMPQASRPGLAGSARVVGGGAIPPPVSTQ